MSDRRFEFGRAFLFFLKSVQALQCSHCEQQYGSGYPGPNCFKKIIMQIGDKQTTATITDEV